MLPASTACVQLLHPGSTSTAVRVIRPFDCSTTIDESHDHSFWRGTPGGSGAHTNISVHDINKPSSDASTRGDARFAPTMTGSQRSFLQGVLTHLPALCALTLPTSHSYARVGDGVWSGGTYATWGTENREATVRLTGSEGQHRFEVRCVDGTASPYLLLSGLLGAGTKALIDGVTLRSAEWPKPIGEMTDEEKAAVGVQTVGRVPRTISQARENLQNDQELKEILGETFVSMFLSCNEVRAQSGSSCADAHLTAAAREDVGRRDRGRNGNKACELLLEC